MATETPPPSRCPDCGAEIPAGLPLGLCARCALTGALDRTTEESESSSATMAEAGDRIGRYKLLEKIGEGGCSLQPDPPAGCRFPRPLFRIDRTMEVSAPPAEVVSAYLGQIRHWRSAVLKFVHRSGTAPGLEIEGLSERARGTLAVFLDSEWSLYTAEQAARSSYNINSFPAHALNPNRSPTGETVLEVLRWRAGFNDYLADVWDVLGEPELTLDECNALGMFLNPAEPSGLCCNCLTGFAPDQQHPDQHGCLLLAHVRAKWPPSPLARLQTDPPKPRAWWQFWK